MTTRRRVSLLVAAVASLGVTTTACSDDPGEFEVRSIDDVGAEEPTFAYVIPAGAGDALDAGTPLEILPAELDARVGDVLEIVNEDDRGHLVGPFFVGANETLTQRFASAGEYSGVCTVHPSGEITVTVT